MYVIYPCAHECIFGPCFIVINGRWGMHHNFCMREDIRKHCPISYVRLAVPVRLIGINLGCRAHRVRCVCELKNLVGKDFSLVVLVRQRMVKLHLSVVAPWIALDFLGT
jgi:hypothetical protein